MTSLEIRLIISKLKKLNRNVSENLEDARQSKAYFEGRKEEKGANYNITDIMTVNEFLEELEKVIESYEKEIEQNNNLIAKLEQELEEVR